MRVAGLCFLFAWFLFYWNILLVLRILHPSPKKKNTCVILPAYFPITVTLFFAQGSHCEGVGRYIFPSGLGSCFRPAWRESFCFTKWKSVAWSKYTTHAQSSRNGFKFPNRQKVLVTMWRSAPPWNTVTLLVFGLAPSQFIQDFREFTQTQCAILFVLVFVLLPQPWKRKKSKAEANFSLFYLFACC